MKVVWQTHIAGGAVEVIFATANPGFKIDFDLSLKLSSRFGAKWGKIIHLQIPHPVQ